MGVKWQRGDVVTPKSDLSDFSSISWVDATDWVSTPLQHRSMQTLQKVLATALELFIARGFDQTTVAEISRQSGVSVGSIYNLFPDKHSIFLALYEHYRTIREAQIVAMMADERWLNPEAVDVVHFHIEIVFSSARDDAGFLRLVEKRRAADSYFHHVLARAEETFCQAILALYHRCAREFDHSDLGAAVRYLHYIIRGAALWSIMPPEPDDTFFNVASRHYQQETLRMACRYLGVAGG